MLRLGRGEEDLGSEPGDTNVEAHGAVLVDGCLESTCRCRCITIGLEVSEPSRHHALKPVRGECVHNAPGKYFTRARATHGFIVVSWIVVAVHDERGSGA